MRQPDKSEGQRGGLVEAGRNACKQERQHFCMDKVVEDCAKAWVDKVPSHEQVGSEEQGREQEPASADDVINVKAQYKQRSAFQLEEHTGFEKGHGLWLLSA